MDGVDRSDRPVNDRYVMVRPNPGALSHTEIFERLVGGVGGPVTEGPTQPLVTNSVTLQHALDKLAVMVNSLSESQQTGSAVLARRAIEFVADHVGALAGMAARVATGFDGYVETYHEVRNRVPEPLPLADQLDAVQEHSPGVLARLPGLAELEEEHNARTAEARELYRRLDLAAVAADDATPAFPLMSTPLTTDQAGTVSTAPAGATTLRPGARTSATPAGSSTPAGPAAPVPSGAVPGLPPPSTSGPVPTPTPAAGGPGQRIDPPRPGWSGSTGGRAGTDGPVRTGRSTGGHYGPGQRWSPLAGGRVPVAGPGREPRPDDRPGGARRFGGGPGPGPAWTADGGSGRTAGARGIAGFGPGDPGPLGAATRQEADRERQRPSYLEAENPHDLFGTNERVAPPVIGEEP